ncbi:LLM class flavin-dependent oxidoreductase [Mycobacterium sp. OTB74]|uniref:LLM class flavin-dependent oxidoreductase n=1 Tax=Mycobacterium sp. OTB74 TaxID=1853452 RepID=UPI0024740D3C|nr:LLM class flavin-dependent oxidoreductase [Mycobacterium sp. OTB74]MDH6242828.1 alkanesulfonate monooxygenase SsuD/methylene tetrahydromethanopterin reductase-like flavin-dependent oxidoreductase (luciferase family) [Mycobacterium sp. OTB74]
MFSMRFDMRAPDFGAPAAELYQAALDMSAWAENNGCLAALVCEHHASPDGYLPTPLILSSAIAARTSALAINAVVLLPLYDPVRLAEEMAVVDIISRGRASFTLGLGYRPTEFEQFGKDIRQRGRIADENVRILRQLLAGEVVELDGRRIEVTPRPFTPGGPLLMWGGGSLAAARRAGRYGLSLLAQANVNGMQEEYERSCREHGHELGTTLLPPRDTPSVCFVAEDLDQAWQEVGPHLLHDARCYSEWNPDNNTSAGISSAETVDQLRQTSQSHRIFTVAEAAAMMAGGEMLNLSPLCGGLAPERAWPYLKRVVEQVIPLAARTQVPLQESTLGGALEDLTTTSRS